ncbi:MAG: DUF262 domain-containing protein [Cytophagales bacterium]|nr:DUF262 domain-containing protein [Cytophagales bacterium]
MASEIVPVVKKVEEVFGSEPYCIDFYQRDYEWGKETVEELLSDVLGKFEDTNSEGNFAGTYYLNTFVIHPKNGNEYLIDGQQRLTTLLLISMVLHRMTKKLSDNGNKWENFSETLKTHIRKRPLGKGEVFVIRHDKDGANPLEGEKFPPHEQTLHELMSEQTDQHNDILQKRGTTSLSMVENYGIIFTELSKRFAKEPQSLELDEDRLESFIHYYMKGILLTKLQVPTEDAPMVFEAINDRGKKLLSWEVLKGKLLGKIQDENEMHDCLDIWKDCIERMKWSKRWNDHKPYLCRRDSQRSPDAFFKGLFEGRFLDSHAHYTKRLGSPKYPYHREFLRKEGVISEDSHSRLETSENEIKDFLEKDLRFYTRLFRYLVYHIRDFHFFTQNIADNELTPDWILLFSGIHSRYYKCPSSNKSPSLEDYDNLDDILIKIRSLSFEKKRFQALINSQSETFKDKAHANYFRQIYPNLREKQNGKWNLKNLRDIFDEAIKDLGGRKDEGGKLLDVLSFKRFRRPADVSRFLQDVELFLSAQTGLETKVFTKEKLQIEHVLGNNPIYEEEFGEVEFHKSIREQLACKVLLDEHLNPKLGNKLYEEKLDAYANESGLIWTGILSKDYHIKHERKLANLKKNFDLDLIPYNKLDKNNIKEFIGEREELLYKITEIMWANNTLEEDAYPKIALHPRHPRSIQNSTK